MAFLRRGNIKFLHSPNAYILLHRLDAFPFKCVLRTISCYEEHAIDLLRNIVTVYFTNNSSVAVREDFDTIAKALKALEVNP